MAVISQEVFLHSCLIAVRLVFDWPVLYLHLMRLAPTICPTHGGPHLDISPRAALAPGAVYLFVFLLICVYFLYIIHFYFVGYFIYSV